MYIYIYICRIYIYIYAEALAKKYICIICTYIYIYISYHSIYVLSHVINEVQARSGKHEQRGKHHNSIHTYRTMLRNIHGAAVVIVQAVHLSEKPQIHLINKLT